MTIILTESALSIMKYCGL